MLQKERWPHERVLQKGRQIIAASEVAVFRYAAALGVKFSLGRLAYEIYSLAILAQIYQIYFFGAILCANLQILYLRV